MANLLDTVGDKKKQTGGISLYIELSFFLLVRLVFGGKLMLSLSLIVSLHQFKNMLDGSVNIAHVAKIDNKERS